MKRHRRLKIALILVACLAIGSIGGFFVYASDYYHADETARLVLIEDPDIRIEGNFTVLEPEEECDTALIFYPGAKVEHTAYLPLLEQLKSRGVTCILVHMPFNMAIFNPNAAEDAFRLAPNAQHWFIGGHSMGGAMASSYASDHSDKVDGLILLGAYVYGSYPPSDALTVYGTFNANLEQNIHYTDNIVVIEGGNHAQFGNYGKQAGDPDATVSSEQQQEIAVDAIMDFITEQKGVQ